MTLEEIKEFAISKGACKSQLNKFIELVDNNDELSAWQTVLGNYDWLHLNCFPMERSEVELCAAGVGKLWHENGQLWYESNYVDGKEHGLCRRWYENGQLYLEINYKEGKLNGLHRAWHPNGQLWIESNYVDGKLRGIYHTYY